MVEACNNWTSRVAALFPNRLMAQQERLGHFDVKLCDFLLCESNILNTMDRREGEGEEKVRPFRDAKSRSGVKPMYSPPPCIIPGVI